MSADPCDALRTELDTWAQAGETAQLWLRDDDAIAPSAQLDRLAGLAGRFNIPVLLAVIPFQAKPSLVERLHDTPLLRPCQHGWQHQNHAAVNEKKSEFGPQRPDDVRLAEISEGQERLRALFGETLLPAFVPPWNRIEPELAARLPELGLTGLSCFRGFTLPGRRGPTLVNSDIDIVDWHGGRIGRTFEQIAGEIARQLTLKRQSGAKAASLGLLLHHRDHDPGAWQTLDRILAVLIGHPAIAATDPVRLFSGVMPG